MSVIIPVLRDGAALARLLETFPAHRSAEIIVVNGDASDVHVRALEARFPGCRWLTSSRGRARQMNAGARAARGEWLLFLHADTLLPPGWLEEVEAAARAPGVVAGCFRFALDTPDLRARLLERGVAMRVRWLQLPYGDQALFVRRDVFEALGGYADLPLMEDVDLVRRLRRRGRLWRSALPATTSARRWVRDGWLHRSLGNLMLVAAYFRGVPPERLAARYHRNAPRRHEVVRPAIAVMARAPSDPSGKTRLVGGLPPVRARALREALLLDTLNAAVSAAPPAVPVILYTPPEARAEFEGLAPGIALMAQRGGDLGQRMSSAFDDLFAAGFDGAVLIGSDLPALPPEYLDRAVAAVRRRDVDVVLGPADDGGYYLVALREPHERLFAGVRWSSPHVLEETLAAAGRAGLRVFLLPVMRDVDTVDDLGVAVCGADRSRAVLVRKWLAGMGAPQ